MELYASVARHISRVIIFSYSTSFSSSMRLFSRQIQPHIASVYGLVRIADEVVDTYRGSSAKKILQELEHDVYRAIKRGYSVNPVVHAFALTAREFGISKSLIHPFFVSMMMDLQPPASYTQKQYTTYIYGSAEVIGLMCLKIFVNGDTKQYVALKKGAQSLGSAYQKVNFIRDIAADATELGRVYFPGVTFATFTDETRDAIIHDIAREFDDAADALRCLPGTSRRAVWLSVLYYRALLKRIARTPADALKQRRVRVNNVHKAVLFCCARFLPVRGLRG